MQIQRRQRRLPVSARPSLYSGRVVPAEHHLHLGSREITPRLTDRPSEADLLGVAITRQRGRHVPLLPAALIDKCLRGDEPGGEFLPVQIDVLAGMSFELGDTRLQLLPAATRRIQFGGHYRNPVRRGIDRRLIGASTCLELHQNGLRRGEFLRAVPMAAPTRLTSTHHRSRNEVI